MSSRSATRKLASAGVAGCMLLGIARDSAAFCSPGLHYAYVGNKTTDSQCNYTTIQAAISDNTLCPNTMIVVTDEVSYTGQNLTIAGKSLSIVGAAAGVHCGPQIGPGNPPVVTSAAMIKIDVTGTSLPAIRITGNSNITLGNLEVLGGNGSITGGGGGVSFIGNGTLRLNTVEIHANSGGSSGAVYFSGSGSLTLDGASIHDNQAASYGGGVNVTASSNGSASMTIIDDPAQPTAIYSNTTDIGGGISMSGNSHLTAIAHDAGRISIYQNHAVDGGGIYLDTQAVADIALPGAGATGIHDNTAQYGGGIYSYGTVHLFNTSPTDATVLSGNSATNTGGGLYLSNGNSTACLYGVGMLSNQAPTGAAIGGGGKLYMDVADNASCNFATVAALGAVQCDATTVDSCDLFTQNLATPATGYGTIIDLEGNVVLQTNRLRLTGNTGQIGIQNFIADGANISFSNCLITDNSFASVSYLRAANPSTNGSTATFDGCTIANNHLQAPQAVWRVGPAPLNFALSNSIVDEPGIPTIDTDGEGILSGISDVLSNDLTTLPNSPDIISGDPHFVNAASGDYHLQATSPAIDFAPASASGSSDLERQPRTVDLPGTDSPGSFNDFGPRDLGAYEYQIGNVHDRIFLGTFE